MGHPEGSQKAGLDMPRKLSIETEANLRKAREAALLAVETYNRPGTAFRSAGYVVLMVIAWTALFHAIFGKKRIKPYYRQKTRSTRFERVDGDFKHWELSECVQHSSKTRIPPRERIWSSSLRLLSTHGPLNLN